MMKGICVFYDLEILPIVDNDTLVPSILVKYVCKMLGNIHELQIFQKGF